MISLETRDTNGISVRDAIQAFDLDPSRIGEARADQNALGYFEIHIEQGPVLEALSLPLAVVDSIVGQSRASVTFEGRASHAGTTPMHLRRDAAAGAAEWISAVEREAQNVPGLVATVGSLVVQPRAANVIPEMREPVSTCGMRTTWFDGNRWSVCWDAPGRSPRAAI